MSAPAFTPGPWMATCGDVTGEREVGDDGLRFWSIQSAGQYRGDICHVHAAEHIGGIMISERDANARLIAAAAELFEALEAALDEREQDHGRIADGPHWTVRARAALAKARGEA